MSVRMLAKLSGLSASAVSLALNGSPKVSADTRRRVQALAEQIGYRRSAKVTELMAHVRAANEPKGAGCLGLISLYDSLRPWEEQEHWRRIHAALCRRAQEFGYRVEPLWLRAPRMTPRRFRTMLDARGIQGLLCFGGPVLDEAFPAELDHYAIVTVGMSISTPLHRVTSHSYRDCQRVLQRIARMGYRRPGLVLHRCEEIRGARAHLGAYLGWYESSQSGTAAIPALRVGETIEEPALEDWLRRHQPDVLIFVHDDAITLTRVLQRLGVSVPEGLGVVLMGHQVVGTGYAGMEQDQQMMGTSMVELLVARLLRQEFGLPASPHVEMVDSRWVEGCSLRALACVPA